jgi:UDP-N-acetyl-D-mannosaminuronic acid dehydrogenase
MFANSGFETLGFDTDPIYRKTIADGQAPYDEPGLGETVERVVTSGRLTVVDMVPEADFHFICVPTPFIEESDRTDLQFVEAAGEAIASVLRPGDTVVLESTVPPGTTEQILQPILEESGLSVGASIRLAFSPETVLPGNIMDELRTNDRLVGNVGDGMLAEIIGLYESFVDGEIRTTDATTAEFVKLIQNAYRDTNIAFANEVAKLAHEHHIDARESIELANSHQRVDILSPGPGVGGHCLPIDPLFLNQNTDRAELIETARRINDGMAAFVTELLTDAVGTLEGTRIAVLGIAYKGGVDDTRHSPALSLVEHLNDAGATVAITDPRVEDEVLPLVSLDVAVTDADAAVLVTDHPEYTDLDPEQLGELMAARVLVDTRAMLDHDRWQTAGFDVSWV